MHSCTYPYRGPTPGAGWMPPGVWVGLEFFQNAIYIISNKFCKKNFALKCILGLTLIGVLPLGQGGRPPGVRVGLQIFSEPYLYNFQQVL